MRSIRKPLVGLGLAVGIILGGVSPAFAHPRQLAAVKDSLERFQHVSYAKKQGFGLVIDVNGVRRLAQPLRAAALLHAARLAVEVEPARAVQPLQPARPLSVI